MRLSPLLKTEEKQTAHLYNLDLLKAVAVISMFFCHPVLQLGMHLPGYEHEIPYLIGHTFFGEYLAAAHAFMFAMGVSIVYSHHNQPGDLIRRGIRIYLLGFVLNFLRYGIYALADGLIEGHFYDETLYSFIVQDIFHFAGLALIATGVFRHLKLNEVHMFLIGVILSMIGAPLAFVIQGSYLQDYLLGHFIATTKECTCFTFLNWYVFVAFGQLFGAILRRTENLDRFYHRVLRVSLPVMVLYIFLTILFGPKFMTKNGIYYAVSLPEAAGLLSIDLTLLSVFHVLLRKYGTAPFFFFIHMGRNTTLIYWIHWCILGFFDSIFCYLLGIKLSFPAIYTFACILMAVTVWIVTQIRKRKRRNRIDIPVTAAMESTRR